MDGGFLFDHRTDGDAGYGKKYNELIKGMYG
jgi:hypothetical protein